MQPIKARLYALLRWSEKYTKTDMVYLAGGGFWLGSGHILTTAVGFAASIAFAYLLPKNAYGDYKYVLSLLAIFSAFTLTGLGTAVIQSVARGFEGSLKQGLRLGFKLSLPAAVAAACGAGYYAYQGNGFLASSLIVVATTIPLINSWGLYAPFLNGKRDFRRLGIYNLLDNATPTVLVLATLMVTQNILVLLTMYLASSALLGLFFYQRTLKIHRPTDVIDVGLKQYSIRLSGLNVIGILTTHIDKVIVYTTLGSVELAIYAFATAFPDQIRALVKQLNTLMIPKLAALPINSRPAIKEKTLRLALLLVVITALYIVTAPFLYSLFFPKYPEAVQYSRILSLIILSSLALIPVSIFIAKKQEDKLAKASIGGSIFQLLLLYPAAYFWGITGVCIARVLGAYAITAIAYGLLRTTRKSE